MTPKPGCAIYVLPQQIASQGTKKNTYKTRREREPSRSFLFFNFKLLSAFTSPLPNIKAIFEGDHMNAFSINSLATAKEHNASDSMKPYHHLSYYYTVYYYYTVAVAALIRGPLGNVAVVAFAIALSQTSVLLYP